jgi:hypothetical protein
VAAGSPGRAKFDSRPLLSLFCLFLLSFFVFSFCLLADADDIDVAHHAREALERLCEDMDRR